MTKLYRDTTELKKQLHFGQFLEQSEHTSQFSAGEKARSFPNAVVTWNSWLICIVPWQ